MSLQRQLFGDIQRPRCCDSDSDRGGLGDVLCYRWEQRAAEQAVLTMRSTFATLGKPAAFATEYQAISDEWDYYDEPYRDLTLCSAKAVGQRAQDLNNRMTGGSANDPNLTPGPTQTWANLTAALKVVAVGGALYYGGKLLLEKRR